MSTVYILWLRQIKKYFRSRSRIVGALGQPLLFLVAFGFGFGSIFQRAGGGDYIQFLAPGIIMMSVLFTAVFSGIDLIWDRQFGFLKETMVAPVSRLEIMIGKTLGGATVAAFQGLLVFVLTLFVGFRPYNLLMLPVAVLFIFLVAILFTSLGIAVASKLEDMQGFQLIMNFLVMPIFFLSGAIFPLEGLPKAMEIITNLDPLTYGIDGLRHSLINTGKFGLATDLVVIGSITAVLLVIGSYFFERIQA
ncbi:MAG: Transport permease protein [Dehalococcoidia bacterium]|nr:Transport permease protein [Dehalococcoidia bacterium]MBF8304197.1 Transport permease protein [Dehalococcoidia bacterium]